VEVIESTWLASHDFLAALVPDGRHVIAEKSGHYIQQDQPDLVIKAVRQVVKAVRHPASWSTPAASPTPATPATGARVMREALGGRAVLVAVDQGGHGGLNASNRT
jgi:TAP-like protein